MMRNYLLNIMKEFHSNSELHVMANMLVTLQFIQPKILDLSAYIPLEIFLNFLCHKVGRLMFEN